VTVTLYYQPTSKEYVEFLRDANTTNSAGQDLYDGWVAQGKAPPVMMQRSTVKVTVTTDVVEDGRRPEPLAFKLDRSFPNPFRGTTTIAFALPQPGRVRVMIYDLRGRLVRTLVDDRREPGRYRTHWDGRNAAGQQVASGVYFIRYDSGSRSLTERTVLLK
jgi:flagellar hook assembly protein FlgD